MKTLVIEGNEYEIEDAVSDLIVMISKERDELDCLVKAIQGTASIGQLRRLLIQYGYQVKM